MLKKYRKNIEEKKTTKKIFLAAEQRHKARLEDLQKESDTLSEARELFQKASILTQNHLAQHLSVIVTQALRTVFYEKDVYFKVEFVERRNVTECDMWIEENGYKYSLLESRGFGMTDISSFALKVAYILLHESDDVLIIDEPFRNLSENKHVIASQMIKELSEELNIQFIIATHVQALRDHSDKSFHISQKNGVSETY